MDGRRVEKLHEIAYSSDTPGNDREEGVRFLLFGKDGRQSARGDFSDRIGYN